MVVVVVVVVVVVIVVIGCCRCHRATVVYSTSGIGMWNLDFHMGNSKLAIYYN